MLFGSLVEASRAVQAASARLAKIEHLAGLLKRLTPEEVPIGVAYLSGELPQGRIGVGYASLRDAASDAASDSGLELIEVHAAFSRIAAASGPGSTRERGRLLRELLVRATRDEQQF